MLRRIRLRLCAPLGTPMASGTLFGHLCWAFLDRHGERELASWLAAMAAGSRPPFLISDAFPADYLPRPLLPPTPADAPAAGGSQDHKRRRRATLVPRELFLRLRREPTGDAAWAEAAAEVAEAVAAGPLVQHAHNTIDRLRNTTPDVAGLWFVEDDWSFTRLPERDVYVDSELSTDELRALFEAVGAEGYGRDITYGRGRFEVIGLEADAALAAPLAGTDVRRVSLSHGCLTANMLDARWRRVTHFGKLAARIDNGRPWKKPLLLMRPGATFRAADGGPFGLLLDRVHHDLPEVRFNAWHLAVPYREAAA